METDKNREVTHKVS